MRTGVCETNPFQAAECGIPPFIGRSTLKKMDAEAKVFGLMNLSPEQMVSYMPPEDEQEYVEDLVNKSKEGTLTEVERAELDYFVQMEHLLQMMRSRAARLLAVRDAA